MIGVERITKAEALRRARKELSYGYFKTPEGGYVIYEGHKVFFCTTAGRITRSEMVRQIADGIYELHQEEAG